jgi:hypothetical protein
MGVYSSWSTATIALHAIVEYSADEVGFNRFKNYRILGDDVVIFNKVVYENFKRNIQSLGMEISDHKSTTSEVSAEMAKRFFVQGKEVTGYPIALIQEVAKLPGGVLEMLRLITDLGHKSVEVVPVLSIMGKTLSSSYAALLSLPKSIGGQPSALSDSALYEGCLPSWD